MTMVPPTADSPSSGLNAAVAAEIRAEMARTRMNTQELAEASGVAYGSLRRYLATERKIDVGVLGKVAEALGVDPAAIVKAARERMESDVSEEPPSLQAVAKEGVVEPEGVEYGDA